MTHSYEDRINRVTAYIYEHLDEPLDLACLADAYGMHLDLFQRIAVGPASLSIVRYGASRPEVVGMNLDDGDLSWLASVAPVGDAAVGGGAGHAADSPAGAGAQAAPGDVAHARS